MRIAFATLGCKINQYETDVMHQELSSNGNTVVPFDEDAEIYIINTCTVTSKSDYRCRQAIRSASGRGKGARVIVTGCYAETRPDEIRAIPGVDLVIGNRDKQWIPDRIKTLASRTDQQFPPSQTLRVRALRGRTRGFLKIQDGCNNRCSYCIVPSARGNSRSADCASILSEFDKMVREECPEIVLTGIHIGTYGTDLASRTNLVSLLNTLTARRKNTRLRLSSIEPCEITRELIDLLGHGLCRHLHIPLQSGDNAVLRAMKRDYTSSFYLELIHSITERVPGIAVGSDIIVGFPGEGNKEFQNTLDLVEKSPLSHLHVFSYSPRPGTSAKEMKNQVSDQTKKKRSEDLRSLARSKNYAFRKQFIGSTMKVVIEDKVDPSTGFLGGLTDNYIRVCVRGADEQVKGKQITAKIAAVEADLTICDLL